VVRFPDHLFRHGWWHHQIDNLRPLRQIGQRTVNLGSVQFTPLGIHRVHCVSSIAQATKDAAPELGWILTGAYHCPCPSSDKISDQSGGPEYSTGLVSLSLLSHLNTPALLF